MLQGACLDLADGGMPYGPLTEALRGFLRDLPPERIDEILGPARDEIGRLLPGIGEDRSRGRARGPANARQPRPTQTKSRRTSAAASARRASSACCCGSSATLRRTRPSS